MSMRDADKLLLFINESKNLNLSIDEHNLHYYIFFANHNGFVFGYNFHIAHDLYSSELHEDLKLLKEGNYLHHGSPLHLTEKGKNFIFRPAFYEEDAVRISRSVLQTYRKMDNSSLFKAAYTILTTA